MEYQDSGFVIVGGENYGQGSSREHAAIAPRYLGMRAALVKSYARIHRQNLANFGILPLMFSDPSDFDRIDQGDVLRLPDVRAAIQDGDQVEVVNETKGDRYTAHHDLTEREVEMVLEGSQVGVIRREFTSPNV
jgi:aconitate hydratase